MCCSEPFCCCFVVVAIDMLLSLLVSLWVQSLVGVVFVAVQAWLREARGRIPSSSQVHLLLLSSSSLPSSPWLSPLSRPTKL